MANYLPIAYVGQNPGLNRNQMEKDFTRFDRANSNTPLWGKEGYRNDKIKADMKTSSRRIATKENAKKYDWER